MAFKSHRTNFRGDLAGIKQECLGELDYSLEKYEDRLSFVEKKYEKYEAYYNEYTDKYYKVNINTDDNLSEDINVFKSIEKDANYLLNSVDLPKQREYKYNLLTQKEFDKVIANENKVDINSDGVMDMLKPSFKNEFTNMDLKITTSDLKEDSELGEILRSYDHVRQHLKEEMKNLKDGVPSYLKLYQIKNMLGSMMGDMLDCKVAYKGITRPSTKLGDIGSKPDWSVIDYTKPEHIKAIITSVRFGELRPESELSHFAYDIKMAIKHLSSEGKLDDKDREIIEAINFGESMRTIANQVGMKHQSVAERANRCYKKIANYYKGLGMVA